MISAIILAAGESKRMGQPKMLLAWGKTTVLGQVIATFRQAGIEHIFVVTGGARQEVDQIVNQYGARSIFNHEYANGEMLSSLQLGLMAQMDQVRATLIGLGDQPQVQVASIELMCETFRDKKSKLIVPSYQHRRGHPWLVERSLWQELLALKSPQSPRDFLNQHAEAIEYVEVNTPTILADLDTPKDYQTSHP
ncbi:MAG TPA: nucleotidyltransferase family protein [Anaerolineales bacterium]|nr:nucleotidyltransferase family protein [Anaerolineales bacterium]